MLCKVNYTLMFVRAKDASDWQRLASELRDASHVRIVHLSPTEGIAEGTWVASYVDERLEYTVVTLASE